MCSNLFIRRLFILTDTGETAYNETYHRGVNIIRGHNSSGKSTIIRFIFFVLGGDYQDFTPEALRCRSVYAEVEIRGAVLTLRRDLEKEDGHVKRMLPMYIYYGTLDESLKDMTSWQRYGYKTTTDRRSFSNVLFAAMGLPEMRADSNITMHQIMRLMYLDQESPLSSLFLYEYFDKEITRDTVAELLMGLYDENLSQAKLRKLEVQRDIDGKQQEIRISERFLTDSKTRSRAFIQTLIDNLTQEIQSILQQVSDLRNKARQDAMEDQMKREYQQMQQRVAALREEEGKIQEEIAGLVADMRDSEYFVRALQRKVDALQLSIQTRDYFGSLHLAYCPECLSKIDDDVDEGHCRLCKSPIDSSRGRSQALRIRLELQFQIKESKTLLARQQEELSAKQAALSAVQDRLQVAQRQYDDALRNVSSTSDEQMDKLLQEKGFKEGEILQYQTLLEQADRYEQLQRDLIELKNELNKLDNYIKATEQKIVHNRRVVERSIAENGVYLLQHDQARQSEFRQATSFKMDFAQNVVYLNNRYLKLSASSEFYLKMSARFALFLSSLQQDSMMFPRLIFSDNMEDKGLEEDRSRNFQKVLVQRLNELETQRRKKLEPEALNFEPSYQVIFATSMIAPELNTPEFTVGEYYTESNKSLKNV